MDQILSQNIILSDLFSYTVFVFCLLSNVNSIFNFHKAYYILDEVMIAGEVQETSKKSILRVCASQDALVEEEIKQSSSKDKGVM